MSPHPPSPSSLSPMQALLRRYYPGLKLASCSAFRVAGFVPVILVLGIIILAYITAVPATLLRLRPHHPFIVALLLIFFHLVFLSTLVNYLLLVFVDPGSPPDDWKAARPSTFPYERSPPGGTQGALAEARVLAERERFREADRESAEGEAMLLQHRGEGDAEGGEERFRYEADMRERAYDGELRYCRKCMAYKPDRSHHCSVCRRCILRMDHHCVFVNNCVSFYNYKFFILFVTYAFVGCFFVAVVSLPTFLALISVSPRRRVSEGGGEKWAEGAARTGWMEGWADVRGMSTTMQMLVVVGYITTAAFTLALSVFVALHFYLVAKGRTTIEMYELTDPVRAARVAEYDLGPARNFRNVFGSVVACWFLPTRAYVSGDGLQFERRELTDQSISEV